MNKAAFAVSLLLGILPVATDAALAQSHRGMDHGDRLAFGTPGEASKVQRTVEVTLHDNYFEPETISVKAGETIRFALSNAGSVVHEFVIGSAPLHREHQPHMQMLMDHGVIEPDRIHRAMMSGGHGMDHAMSYDLPNGRLLAPGDSGELIWSFAATTEAVEFACNLPGHYDSGMVGTLTIDR